MSVSYELRFTGLPSMGKNTSSLQKVTREEAENSHNPVVEVLTPKEFCELNIEECSDLPYMEELDDSEANFVDTYPKHLIGSFCVPAKGFAEPATFAFYMDREKLVFVNEEDVPERILEKIAESGVMKTMSTAHCLYVFIKELVVDDLVYMGQIEDELEDIEEGLVDKKREISTAQIMRYRRLAMRFVSYYQQIAAMAYMLADNENKMMSHEEAHQFDHIGNLADRLTSRAETIQDYSLQLHELHQTYIDLKQNAIMQLFTIVTVLIAPLTLVTGWFGMNLKTLPGIDVQSMWFILIGLFVVCTIALLLVFKRKKWL